MPDWLPPPNPPPSDGSETSSPNLRIPPTQKTREIHKYPVYPKISVMGEKPLYWVDREAKDWLLASSGATWITKRGKALRLTRAKMIGDSTDFRDISLQMGPRVIEANADGIPYAVAATAGWA